MGDVKEAVKGKPSKKQLKSRSKTSKGNLVEQFSELQDQVSDLITKKDDDVIKEGDTARPENERKAATLRSIHTLLNSAKNLAEDY